MTEFICKICGKQCGSKGIGSHLKRKHQISNKEYYDTFLKSKDEDKCKICGKSTTFDTILTGYRKYCSTKCLNLDPEIRAKIENTNLERFGARGNFGRKEVSQKAIKNSQSEQGKQKRAQTNIEKYGSANVFGSEEIKNKIKHTCQLRYNVNYASQAEKTKNNIRQTQIKHFGDHHMRVAKAIESIKKQRLDRLNTFAINNDCTRKRDLINEYGSGWYQAGIVPLIKQSGVLFVKNEYIPKIIEYSKLTNTYTSKYERDLVDFIKTFYFDDIMTNIRTIIHPMELDIYLPNINIAIEYNGTYWHSIERGIDKGYHLRKSLRCREKDIHLIHIYEFEDFEEQKQLLKDLINGQDNYPNNDFNKNNLLDQIPNPEIIYKDNNYTIYGAGKLVQNNLLSIDTLVEVKD